MMADCRENQSLKSVRKPSVSLGYLYCSAFLHWRDCLVPLLRGCKMTKDVSRKQLAVLRLLLKRPNMFTVYRISIKTPKEDEEKKKSQVFSIFPLVELFLFVT